MSSFIRSMPSAGLIEMPPVSNVIPLPTSPSTGPGRRARRLVAEGNQARRLAAAARDAEQQAHAERFDLPLVENLDRRAAGRCDGGGPRRELARRQRIARLVGELAREVAALAEQPAALERRLDARRAFRRCVVERRQRQSSIPAGRRLVGGLVDARAEFGERQPLDRLPA